MTYTATNSASFCKPIFEVGTYEDNGSGYYVITTDVIDGVRYRRLASTRFYNKLDARLRLREVLRYKPSASLILYLAEP
ncbi:MULTISPECIES: hypothetical protein [unclassified Methylophaga]|jgi:hypothetical protein|uniref:hypothetical protein n=1 Tax=unclassified Methylophaga TaxID=2629249 RepID=UPI00259C90FF|nr:MULTISPECIES: hypothetical protein [unclassified Methylophaga]